ncbi:MULTISPECIES: hypothetical protein [unclassified Acinetobacter]|uniref:hypothetical protein n=1 Tax=unclassified Acinetobacter TaxID=196816 RepID=UPI0025C12133|nr:MULTISPECIES: hypothetical protein [unclassified Acinetobacter]
MKKYSQVLLLTLFGFTGTAAIAAESIPPEATAAAEAQQAANEYQHEQEQKTNSSHE